MATVPVPSKFLHRLWLVVLMGLSVALVAIFAAWDARRESTAALAEFAEEQATLADSGETKPRASPRLLCGEEGLGGPRRGLFGNPRTVVNNGERYLPTRLSNCTVAR